MTEQNPDAVKPAPGASDVAGDRAQANPPDPRAEAIERGARDWARFAYDQAEKECGGDVVKLIELLFDQMRVASRTSTLILEMALKVMAFRRQKQGRPLG